MKELVVFVGFFQIMIIHPLSILIRENPLN
jgi:hypothetical protein